MMDKEKVEKILSGRVNKEELIEVMHDLQAEFNYLPEDALVMVANSFSLPLIEVYRVANFYKAFSLAPKGENIITVCSGTACHVRGAPRLVEELCLILEIEPECTTEDGMFTVETVNCLGCCALGPVMVVNGEYYDHVTSGKLRKTIKNLKNKGREKVVANA